MGWTIDLSTMADGPSLASFPLLSKIMSLSSLSSRFQLEDRLANHPQSYIHNGHDVIQGLRRSPKTLPPHYFYDDRGSQLFEQICTLPEYYPTRTEAAILTAIAPELVQQIGPCDLIELGSGSSTKTRILLSAFDQRRIPLRYIPVDVSGTILAENAHALLTTYPHLEIQGLISTYHLALGNLPAPAYPHRLMAFLGSSLGNFSPNACDDFFTQVAQALDPGDYFLLGVDLIKETARLEAAYNDSQGVTAAFNLNLLRHLNWRFGGNFDLTQFDHRAIFNPTDRQIEMYLQSRSPQTIHLQGLDLTVTLEAEESILTEISRKFSLQGPHSLPDHLTRFGLKPQRLWTDEAQWFALILCQR